MRRIRLSESTFGVEECRIVNRLMKSGYVTRGKLAERFVAAMHGWLGLPESKSAMMVNSGSSANLLWSMMLKRVTKH